ncbi:MAG: phosphopantetheine-binding protein [Actinomycetota bacterium]
MEITPDTRLADDLALDSLSLFALVVIIEDMLGEQVPDDLVPALVTVGDVWHHLDTRGGDTRS